MKWTNKNNRSYAIRLLLPLRIVFIYIMIIEVIIYSKNETYLYSMVNIFMLCILIFFSTISWIKWAKYNIQLIELRNDSLKISYLKYNQKREIICRTNDICFEMKSRYSSRGYWSIYCKGKLIIKQEYFYWKSELDLLKLHEELKKHLPTGCVVTV